MQRLSKKIFTHNATVRVGKSRHGKGLFAQKKLLPNQKIFQVTGSFLLGDADDSHIDEQVISNTYRYDTDWYISPTGRVGDFLNHSCNPNAKVVKKQKKLYVLAHTTIKPNEEIVIDYSTIIADDDIWKMKCSCGNKNCRKIIGKFSRIPKKLQKEYLTLGVVPEYILAINKN